MIQNAVNIQSQNSNTPCFNRTTCNDDTKTLINTGRQEGILPTSRYFAKKCVTLMNASKNGKLTNRHNLNLR